MTQCQQLDLSVSLSHNIIVMGLLFKMY
uniref:Uncharacterized protein n=1 Tax=Anguilla anguilla TaxID=7936 RepID=A0A0E9UU92_ANGAN